jgi:hypothetical protein
MEGRTADLAVVIVSFNDAEWLPRCLSTLLASTAGLDVEVVVVSNGTDHTPELVRDRFPGVRVVRTENHGFAQANNQALKRIDARYVLFLNPDTEVIQGSLTDLIARVEALSDVGLAGCRQVSSSGSLHFTMRRFPTALRILGEALGSERWPYRPAWSGQRILARARYEREDDCDWTVGSFMLCRREALQAAGWLDERFFMYCEEVDLALRIKQAGWRVRHFPQLVIVHHAGKMGWSQRGYAQYAFASRQYFEKHFHGAQRLSANAAAAFNYGARAYAFRWKRQDRSEAVAAMRRAFEVSLGHGPAPFEAPPVTALRSTATSRPSTPEN